MFKISTRPRVTRRVPLFIEVDGERLDCSFTATFQIQPLSTMAGDALNSDEGQLAFLRKAVVHLDDMVDDEEKPVAFSVELLEQLLDRPEVRMALISSYSQAQIETASGN